MDQIQIGLWVTAGLLVLVVMGMRVAFAAALAGVVGLILIFWAKKDFDPEKFGWALTVAVKQAGQVPHSKIGYLIPCLFQVSKTQDKVESLI